LRNLAFPFICLGLLSQPLLQGAAQTISLEWSLRTGARSDSTIALGSDGALYFGTFDGNLWAVDAEGKKRWVFHAGREIRSAPAIGADGVLYFGSRDRKFYAVDAQGRKKWEFKTGGWVDSSPALAIDGTICFGSWDKNFYALNPDGTRKWIFETGAPIVSSPAIDREGRIYFGSHDQKFYALATDGKKLWDFAVGGPIVSSPAIDQDGALYFTSVDGNFYALNPDGTLRWRLHTGGISESSPVISQDGIIYVGVNQFLTAITRDGKKKWDRGNEDLIDATPLALANNSICYVSQWGVLTTLAPDRQPYWTYFLGTEYGRASPTVGSNGTIYVPGAYHDVIALRTNVPLAKSPWPKFRGNSKNTGVVQVAN
jgi:outer membrane protein assembly factor BamB